MRAKILLTVGVLGAAAVWAAPSPILQAMRAELERSMSKLVLEGENPPYFISYLLVDRNEFYTNASLGALMSSNDEHTRFVNVEVRVGDYTFDNMPAAEDIFDFDQDKQEQDALYAKVPLPLTDEPLLLRHALWLATDMRYKWALKQYAAKEGQRAREVEEERSDDFSHEVPVNYIRDVASFTVDRAKWEEKVRDYSAVFKEHPEILESTVSFSLEAKSDYFASTEGSEIQQGKTGYWLRISASTKAPDGMWVRSYRTFFGWDESELPPDSVVAGEINALIGEVLSLRDAPVMEAYAGPALIEGQAAGVFMHETFGHRFESHRQESKVYGETFKDKVGTKIMPGFISVYDDPGLKEYQGIPLDGYYLYDEEGVPAKRTELVKEGILVGFLCSRKPIKGFSNSNGHGRAMMQTVGYGDVPVPRQGNLILETSKPQAFSQLKRMLLAECRRAQKPYGLIFVRSEGGATNVGRSFMEAFESSPLLVYRVDARTGIEELVRGVKFGGTPLVALDKILATGDDPAVFNGFCGAESGAVPVGIVSPSILLAEIEIAKEPASTQKPPILPPPSDEDNDNHSPEP